MRPRYIGFLSSAAGSASALFIPVFAKQLQASPEQIGLIVAGFNAFALSSSFLFGRAADVQGGRRILRAGLGLSAVAALTQPLAFDPWSLLAVRAFLGFAVGIYPAALLAYAKTADSFMGKFASFGSLGWGAGSLAAGAVAQVFPGTFWQVFAISSGLWFVAFLGASTGFAEGTGGMRVPFFPVAIIRRNLAVYSTMFVRQTGANMVWVVFPLYLKEILGFSDLQVGAIYAFNPAIQFVVMQRIDRVGSVRLIVAGLVGSAATFILLAVVRDFVSMMATQVVLGFSFSTLYVGCLKFLTETNPETATAGGIFNSVMSFSSILGPIFGGFLAVSSYTTPMYGAAAASAVALGVYLVSLARLKAAGRVPSGPSSG